MKKLLYTLLLAAAASSPAAAGLKMDAASLQIAQAYRLSKLNPGALIACPADMPFSLDAVSRSASPVGAVIILADGATASDIEAYGLKVETVVGDVVVASGLMEDVLELAESDAVKEVNFPKPLAVNTINARKATNHNDVLTGDGTRPAYDGTGVVCGIFDNGVDPNHLNFLTSDLSAPRVKAVYNFPGTTGGSNDYLTPEKVSAFTTDTKNNDHGTHTMGIMAGSFNKKGNGTVGGKSLAGRTAAITSSGGANTLSSRRNEYYGCAPGAEIIAGCGQLYDANIIAGVGKMVDYIKASGKPGVINLSLGSTLGSHDGTDAIGRALNNYGKDVIICVSAGNDGEDNISITKTFSGSDNKVQTVLNSVGTHTGNIQIYSNSDKKFKLQFFLYDAKKGAPSWTYDVNGDVTLTTKKYNDPSYKHAAEFDEAFSDGYFITTESSSNNDNGRYNVSVSYTLTFNSMTNSDKNLKLGFVVTGEDGQRIDVVNRPTNSSAAVFMSGMGVAGWDNATPDFSINNMSCAPNVISVGSYTTAVNFPVLANGVYGYKFNLDERTGFSSYGTLVDGRVLPDILAPGATLISSINSYLTDGMDASKLNSNYTADFEWNGRHYYWGDMCGTSMASPFVAGCIATWLQAYPGLTPSQVKDVVLKAGVNDESTLADPKRCGVGKFNSLKGLLEALKYSGVSDIRADQAKLILTNEGGAYTAIIAGAASMDVKVYNMAGNLVATASEQGEQATVSTQNLTPGIYIINVNGSESRRVVVK